MSAAVISTLIFASPGASAFSGSRTDLVPADDATFAHAKASGVGNEPVSASDPSADYWHALAIKRLHLLGKRERRIVALLVRIHKLRANSPGARARPNAAVGSPASVICSVFGSHCSEAISVATCESHLNIWAVNGQYVNLFQMGYNERRRYGWHVAGSPAILAARAAYRYFLAAGGWGPWQCKP